MKVEPFDRSVPFRGPLFLGFLWISCFLWRKCKKPYDSYPYLVSISHMCANFHQNRTNNKVFLFYLYGPLKLQAKTSNPLIVSGLLKFKNENHRFWGCLKFICILNLLIWAIKQRSGNLFIVHELHFQGKLFQILIDPKSI